MANLNVCAVCGKPIETKESRFVDIGRGGAQIHVHTGCKGKSLQP